MADACEILGMSIIDTVAQCNTAATVLGLSDTTATEGIDSAAYRPYGCCWNRGTLQLNLNSAARLRGTAPDNTVQQVCIANAPGNPLSNAPSILHASTCAFVVCCSLFLYLESFESCCCRISHCGVD